MSLKSINRVLGWESMLIISTYGGFLRILPLPKVVIWGISITAAGIAFVLSSGKIILRPAHISNNTLLVLGLFLVLFAWAVISILWSPISTNHLVSSDIFTALFVVFPTLALLICGNTAPDIEIRCVTGLVLTLFPVFLYILLRWMLSDLPLHNMLLQMSLDKGVGNIYLGAGIIFMLSSLGLILWSIYARSHRKLTLIAGIFTFILSIQAGGRGPVLSGILTMLVIALFTIIQRRAITRKWLNVIGVVFISIVLIVVLLISFSDVIYINRIHSKTAISQRFSSDKERGFDEKSSIGFRLAQYKEVFSFISDRPIIGNGIFSYRVLTSFHDNIYPHNIILDIWGDLGFIGLIMLILMISIALRSCWLIIKFNTSVYSIICVAVFLFFLIESQFSGYIYRSQLWIWLSIVVVCSGDRLYRKSTLNMQVLS